MRRSAEGGNKGRVGEWRCGSNSSSDGSSNDEADCQEDMNRFGVRWEKVARLTKEKLMNYGIHTMEVARILISSFIALFVAGRTAVLESKHM